MSQWDERVALTHTLEAAPYIVLKDLRQGGSLAPSNTPPRDLFPEPLRGFQNFNALEFGKACRGSYLFEAVHFTNGLQTWEAPVSSLFFRRARWGGCKWQLGGSVQNASFLG